MAKLKPTGRRLAPGMAHKYFAENLGLWNKLKEGKTIEVPDEEVETILQVFGMSVELIAENKSKGTPLKNLMEK